MSESFEQQRPKDSAFVKAIPVALILAGVVWLLVLLTGDPAGELALRLPGADGTPEVIPGQEEPAEIKGELVMGDGEPADLPGAWPRFRGAGLDGISTEEVAFARTWPDDGPRQLWSVDLGEGYAGAAVRAGRVYVLDYDQENKADTIRCLSLADGKEIWRYWYPVKIKRQHGMSRTIPTVTEKHLIAFGPKCHVTCLDPVTGEFKWMLNLVRDFGATVPQWYAGQCPLIEDGKVIIAPGGESLMMAADCESGEIIWQTPNPRKWKMTHSSIMPIEFAGRRIYLYCASGGVVGISAEEGAVLWEITDWRIRIANVPTPVVVGDGMIFLSGGYNAGSMMLQLTENEGQIGAEILFRLRHKVFGAEQQTPIFYDGYIYGVRPDRQLVCLDLQGNVVWASGSGKKFYLGPYTIANGLIYALDDFGLLRLVEATPAGYQQLAEAKVIDGHECWGPMAVAGGRLVLRDLKRMICLDITEWKAAKVEP